MRRSRRGSQPSRAGRQTRSARCAALARVRLRRGAFGGATSGRRAATLVELALASTVFVVGILGASTYFFYGQMALNTARHRAVAVQLAHSRLEELRTVSFATITSFQEQDYEVDLDGMTGARDTVVEDIDEDVDQTVDYRKITVTVTWTENSLAQEVELATFHSPYR